MVFDREIGMVTGGFFNERTSIVLQIIIICVTRTTTIAAPVPFYSIPKKRKFNNYFTKNRQNIANENDSGYDEYDRPLVYRDFYLRGYRNENSKTWNIPEVATRDRQSRINRMSDSNGMRRSFDRTDGMTRILTFPLKDSDRGMIRGFEPGDAANDCLTGGLDAGVVDGSLKIGIGVGLAPGCGTEQPPKMIPVFIPRPVPVPVGVPQPYPVAIDVPRPVPIRVPQPIPFPSMNMGPLPMMGRMPPFLSRMMIGNGNCLFQNCEKPSGGIRSGPQRRTIRKYEVAIDQNEFAENTVMPEFESMIYRSLESTNRTR